MAILVDVHGSCVSRNCFNLIDQSLIKVNYYFSRNNIVSCMMPPANFKFISGELVQYNSEYSERCMSLALNKQTLPLLLQSDAEFIVIDFFDFCQPVAGFNDTTFSTYDYTFYNTSIYQQNQKDFCLIDFLSLPPCLWYGYVDIYFKKLFDKYSNHIILNRLSCSNLYISSRGGGKTNSRESM